MDIRQIIERVKILKKIQSDGEVAALIEKSIEDFDNPDKLDSLISAFIKWGIMENLDLNWLVNGNSDQLNLDDFELSCRPLESKLLADVINNLEIYLENNRLSLGHKSKARLIALMYEDAINMGNEIKWEDLGNYLKLIA